MTGRYVLVGMKRIVQVAALAGLVASTFLYPAMAQDAGQQAAKPAMMAKDADPGWEAVTVKPSDPDYKFDFFTVRGRHVIAKNQTAESMLRTAYGLQRNQFVGLPDWIRTEHFDVDGVPDTVGEPNAKQVQSLMRKLLADRFGLKAHHEQREMAVYALTVAKGGPRLEPSKADPNGMPANVGGNDNGRQSRKFTNVAMADLAPMLQFNTDRPIVDKTGLTGRYDFKLQWTVDQSGAGEPDAPPGLFTAIQEQIGLKLEPVKAMADVLVVDTVNKPTAN
jgi:uncharacterized protein (TIGR03435 family)